MSSRQPPGDPTAQPPVSFLGGRGQVLSSRGNANPLSGLANPFRPSVVPVNPVHGTNYLQQPMTATRYNTLRRTPTVFSDDLLPEENISYDDPRLALGVPTPMPPPWRGPESISSGSQGMGRNPLSNPQLFGDDIYRSFGSMRFAQPQARPAYAPGSYHQPFVAPVQSLDAIVANTTSYPYASASNPWPSSYTQLSTSPPPQVDVTRPWSPPASRIPVLDPQNIGRWIRVTKVSPETTIHCVLYLLQGFTTIDGPFLNGLSSAGQFYVGFLDLRESQQAIERIQKIYPEWVVEFVTRDTFRVSSQLVITPPRSFEDFVQVGIYVGPESVVTPTNVESLVKPVLELVGSVLTFEERLFDDTPNARLRMHEFRVRFMDSRCAMNAAKSLSGFRNEYFIMEVMPWGTDGEQQVRHWTYCKMSGKRAQNEPYLSPGAEEAAEKSAVVNTIDNQAIDDGRILRGLEPRTMVMIKSLPEGMRWTDLKKVLDVTSLGRYDYIYVRMNFEQNAHLGYAFVNFVTPRDVLEFTDARTGRTWPGFEGQVEKVGTFSYAKDQGIGPVVEKFRNSPVILELSDYRPKLFYTEGPNVGQEKEFPPVNNFYQLWKGVDRSKKTTLFSHSRSGGTLRKSRRYGDEIQSPLNTKGTETGVDPDTPFQFTAGRRNPRVYPTLKDVFPDA